MKKTFLRSPSSLANAIAIVAIGMHPLVANEFRWTANSSTSPTNWNDSRNWRHIDNILDGIFDDGKIPGIGDISIVNNSDVVSPTLSENQTIGQLNLTHGAKLYTGRHADSSLDNRLLIVQGATNIDGFSSALHVRDQISVQRQVEFKTDDLNIGFGADLQMDGGSAEISGEIVLQAAGEITGHGSVTMVDPDQDLLNNNGRIVATGGELRISRHSNSNAFLNLGGSNQTGRLAAQQDSRLIIDKFFYDHITHRAGMTIGENAEIEIVPDWTHVNTPVANVSFHGGSGTATLSGGHFYSQAGINVITGTARLESDVHLNSHLQMEPNTTLEIASDSVFSPAATTTMTDGVLLEIHGSLRVESADFDWDGPTENSTTHVRSGGSFSFIGTTLETNLFAPGFSGTLIVDHDAVAHIDPTLPPGFDDSWLLDGTVQLQGTPLSPAKLQGSRIRSEGLLAGSGVIEAIFENTSGTIAPGGPEIGTMTFDDILTLTSAGVVEIDVSGLVPSSSHDRIQVNGPVSLGGMLNVELANNYQPPVVGTDDITILQSNVRLGTFANSGQAMDFENGRFGLIGYTSQDVTLSMYQALPGDANGDRTFDSNDLIQVFQSGEYEDDLSGNSTWAEGDWNGDGEFDSSDMIAAFQTGNYSTGLFATVPEPRSTSVLLLPLLILLRRLRAVDFSQIC